MKYSDTIILHNTFVFKGGGDEMNLLCFASTSYKKMKSFLNFLVPYPKAHSIFLLCILIFVGQ